VARPGLLDADGISGRRPQCRKPFTDGKIPGTLVGTARPAFPEQLVEIKFVARI
jgi:hypothetical protein